MKKLNIGLIGPNTKDKLKILNRLTSIDIKEEVEKMDDNSIYTLNHYKVYTYSPLSATLKFTKIKSDFYDESYLEELNNLPNSEAFLKINTYDFISKVERIYIDLPISQDINLNNIYQAVRIYENRGFLDGEIFKDHVVYNKPIVNQVIFSSLDFVKGSNKYVDCMLKENYNRAPFLIDDILSDDNSKAEILKNAYDDLIENIKDKFFGYIII